MRSRLPGILWIHWRSIAYTHTCTQAQTSPSCIFWLSSYISTPSFPPSLLSSPPLASLLAHLATFKVGDGSESSKIFFFFVDSQRGSETGARVWLQLLIKNRHWPVCHEVRNLSRLLCGRCRDPYEDILYCQLWNKQKKGGRGLKFTPCQLHFLKHGVTL